MSRIRLLDENLINQIAAGEVVESPASVLKEIIENSIDAGALDIQIEIRDGGFQVLRISDDGCGMNREDLQLCLLRHATSKLHTISDLEDITTLGFRGEALASIAAVSHLSLVTRERPTAGSIEMSEALELRFIKKGSFGEGSYEVLPASRSFGTTVEIADLFYNVPARKAFQKSSSASSSEISRLVGHLALAYPHVALSYTTQGKLQLSTQRVADKATLNDWPLKPWRSRCALVMGENFEKQAYEIDFNPKTASILNHKLGHYSDRESGEKASLRQMKGLLGHPLDHRPTRSNQVWVINGRIVQAPQLSRAVQEGYGTRLPSGRFPQFVLHLELPGIEVDVNVHPQKRELRFKEVGRIASWIAHAVNMALARPSVSLNSEQNAPLLLASLQQSHRLPWQETSLEELASEVESSESAFNSPIAPNDPDQNASHPSERSLDAQPRDEQLQNSLDKPSFPWSSADRTRGNDLPKSPHERFDHSPFQKQLKLPYEGRVRDFSPYTPEIGSIDLYLRPIAVWKQWSLWRKEDLSSRLAGWDHAIESKGKAAPLAWMSSLRASARIRYEQSLGIKEQVLTQTLLLPKKIEQSLQVIEQLMSIAELIHLCGFEIVQIDRSSIAVHAIPVGLEEELLLDLFSELAESLHEQGSMTRQEVAFAVASRMEKASHSLALVPEQLLLALMRCKEPFFSPSGRAIFRPLFEEEMELKGPERLMAKGKK